jgi:heme exporter protein A
VPELAGLQCQNITLARGRHILFRDLTFEVAAGETLAVEGPNGVGKTSLLRLLAGYLEPLAGVVLMRMRAGEPIAGAEVRGRFVGWLGQQDGLKPQLTPSESLRFFARYHGRSANVDSTLSEAGLGRVGELPVSYLSAGQRRRLALARLSLLERPVWLLDEPLSALDSAGRLLAAELIKTHCARGGLAIAATHEPLGLDCRRLILGT